MRLAAAGGGRRALARLGSTVSHRAVAAALPAASSPPGGALLPRLLVFGVRPSSESMRQEVTALLDAGRTREAIASCYAALRAHAGIDTDTLVRLMAQAVTCPGSKAELEDAVLRLSSALLYLPVFSAATAVPGAGVAPVSLPRLTQQQLETAMHALASFGHHARVIMLAEHAVHQGVALTESMLLSLMRAFGVAAQAYAYSEAQVLQLLAAARALVSAAGHPGLPIRLAVGLLRMLLAPRHLWVSNRLGAIATAVSGGQALAGPGEVAGADSGGADDSVVRRAALAAAEALTSRPDPVVDAALALVPLMPPHALAHGDVLRPLLALCLSRGKRDRAFQLLAAAQARGALVPAAVFNDMIITDAPVSFEAAEVYLRMMSDAGTLPGQPAPLPPPAAPNCNGSLPAATRHPPSPHSVCADRWTLHALTKAYLYSLQRDGTGVAAFIERMSAALAVPVSQRTLGLASFHAARHSNTAEVARLLALAPMAVGAGEAEPPAATADGAASAPAPRWLQRLTALYASKAQAVDYDDNDDDDARGGLPAPSPPLAGAAGSSSSSVR